MRLEVVNREYQHILSFNTTPITRCREIFDSVTDAIGDYPRMRLMIIRNGGEIRNNEILVNVLDIIDGDIIMFVSGGFGQAGDFPPNLRPLGQLQARGVAVNDDMRERMPRIIPFRGVAPPARAARAAPGGAGARAAGADDDFGFRGQLLRGVRGLQAGRAAAMNANAALARALQLEEQGNGAGAMNANAALARALQLEEQGNGAGAGADLNANIPENIGLADAANLTSRNLLKRLEPILAEAGPAFMISFCPVCLLPGTKDDPGACLYLGNHNCLQVAGRDLNRNLHQKYFQDIGANATFCAECGRACNAHGHYRLTPSNDLRRPPIAGVDHAAAAIAHPNGGFWACRAAGGGGRIELVARMLGIRDAFEARLARGRVVDSPELRVILSNAAEDSAGNPEQLRRAEQVIRVGGFDRIIRAPRGIGPPARGAVAVNAADAQRLPAQAQAAVPALLRIIPELPEMQWILARGVDIVRGGLQAAAQGLFQVCAVRLRPRAPPAIEDLNENAVLAAANRIRAARLGRPVAVPPGPPGPPVAAMVAGGRCFMHDILGEDLAPGTAVYRFTHMNNPPGGVAINYVHPDGQLICLEHLTEHINSKLPRPDRPVNDQPDSRCFTSGRDGCGGEIHPNEIRGIVPVDLYNQYLASWNALHGIAGGRYRLKKIRNDHKTARKGRKGRKTRKVRHS